MRNGLCGINSRSHSAERIGERVYMAIEVIQLKHQRKGLKKKNAQSFHDYRTEFSELSSFPDSKLALAQRETLQEVWEEAGCEGLPSRVAG